ncbi:hypothetical protein [uncultured Sphingomonas sp.]|uniref:hypothetical protein n=1 Tax=uncultured Sphingomonas sp. TaxID=158754 RepID=UPI0035CA5CC2
MSSDSKSFSSLSSGLLARKGQARPAMRPQAFTGGYSNLGGSLDDLGWNDMGEPAEPTPLVQGPVVQGEPVIAPPPPGVPPVLAQRAQLKEEFEPDPVPADPAPVTEPLSADDSGSAIAAIAPPVATHTISPASARRIARDTRHKGRAAFTLRLDAERHLRLRLANAVCGRSSQQLVVEALDAFLQKLPQVEELARQLPGRAKE